MDGDDVVIPETMHIMCCVDGCETTATCVSKGNGRGRRWDLYCDLHFSHMGIPESCRTAMSIDALWILLGERDRGDKLEMLITERDTCPGCNNIVGQNHVAKEKCARCKTLFPCRIWCDLGEDERMLCYYVDKHTEFYGKDNLGPHDVESICYDCATSCRECGECICLGEKCAIPVKDADGELKHVCRECNDEMHAKEAQSPQKKSKQAVE